MLLLKLLERFRSTDFSNDRHNQKLIHNPVKHLRWSFFAKIFNNFQLLIIFAKSFILDVSQASGYASAKDKYGSRYSRIDQIKFVEDSR